MEANKLELPQAELQEILFETLKKEKYGDKYIQRYEMITKFYQKRVPFVIMITGTECMGKSTLVTQLAERINISNILQTSIVKKVMEKLIKQVKE